MDIKKYISSGILENYVLGLVSESERQEVERYALEYPEIKKEINLIEVAMETYAQSKAIQPPAGLLEKIMSYVKDKDLPNVKSIDSSKLVSRFWRAIAIAASILALIPLFLFIIQNGELKEIKQQAEQFEEECITKEDNLKKELAIIRNIGGQVIAMAGTAKAPTASTKVYWNEEQKTAYLDVESLPTPPSDKQYQLWAIVEGTPVDMGVFDIDPTDTLVPAPFIENPAAFAITLEPKGGSVAPTLDEMVVIGEV